MGYRPLSTTEIRQLEGQGCLAEDWARVQVSEPFAVARVRDTSFSGDVRLGDLSGALRHEGGVVQPCGLYRTRVHQCCIGAGCRIANVGTLANYDVGDDVWIENVASLLVTGETSFGNGVEIDVMNEAGGRSLPLCDRLSAQLAYLIVLHRHDPELTGRLADLVRSYAAGRRSSVGWIGAGARIRECGPIADVHIDAFTRIEGAAALAEGTIRSCREAPVTIGAGVIARRFIILSGSTVEQGAIIERCFLGQSVRMGKQYSAENSAFFCNSELFHGEGCSVFAGPYTVTHHKSTLLIAGLFSFYNAGSGTNQSNHMYKLGPVHQGVLERGCKTGSFSYLLWPSRVGAFSVVLGKHQAHFDTSDLPFSVINEHDGRSVCIPAMNMFTVGTRRDSLKWPARDGRRDPDRLDQVHFALWSPLVIGRILRGLGRLGELAGRAREGQEFLNFNGIAVQKLLVRTTGKYYELAIRLFLGGCLLRRLEAAAEAGSLADMQASLSGEVAAELHPWHDLAGMLLPEPVLAGLVAEVLSGELADLDAFHERCRRIHADYERHEWAWCARLLEQRTGQSMRAISAAALTTVVAEWHAAVVKFNNMIVQDATKEFDADVKWGFGIDGDGTVRDADFAAVRGTHEANSFVQSVREDSAAASARAERVTEWLRGLS